MADSKKSTIGVSALRSERWTPWLKIDDNLTGEWDALGGEETIAPSFGRKFDVYMRGGREHALRIAAKLGGAYTLCWAWPNWTGGRSRS